MADSTSRATPQKRARAERYSPHFFKPLLPGFVDNFSIPKSFLKYLRPGSSTNGEDLVAVLKSRCSAGVGEKKAWRVVVDGEGRRFKFMDGWKEFAHDQSLQIGDFLVFRYLGSFVFEVLVFDPVTACERYVSADLPHPLLSSCHSETNGHLKLSDARQRCSLTCPHTIQENNGGKDHEMTEQNVDEANGRFHYAKGNKITEGKSPEVIRVKVEVKDHEMSDRSLGFNAQSEEMGHIHPLDSANIQHVEPGGAQYDTVKEFNITKRSRLEVLQTNAEAKDHGMSRKNHEVNAQSDAGHTLPLDSANIQPVETRELHSNEQGNSCHEEIGGNVDSGKTNPTNSPEESSKTEEITDFVPSGRPYFRTSVKQYCFKWHAMLIPTDFARLNNLAKRWCEMTLIDQKDREWVINLRHRKSGKDQVYLASGWDQFQAANKLKIGDSVVFELINSGSQPIMKFYKLS